MSTDVDPFDLLTAEWVSLCEDTWRGQVVAGWLRDEGVLDGQDVPTDLKTLLRLLAWRDRRQGRDHSDAWLAVLLGRAVAEGDEGQLAARVVVQAMVPSAVRTTRRLLRSDGRRWADVAQVVVACLCQVVRTYPLSRRPRRIAANVVMETVHWASREVRSEWEPLGDVLDGEFPARVQDGAEGSGDPVLLAELVVLSEAASAARLYAGDNGVDELSGARGEVVEVLLWALGEGVLPEKSAVELTEYYRDQARSIGRAHGASPADRMRRSRAVQRLRKAAPAYLAQAC